MVSPCRIGKSPEKSQPALERFQIVPWPLEWTRVVGNSAVHGEAAVGTNREGHGGLTGWRIVGGMRRESKGRRQSFSLRRNSLLNAREEPAIRLGGPKEKEILSRH
jgi:hypothetical protein